MKQQNGFALVELMVVIAIVSVLSAMVVLNIPAWRASSAIKTFSRNLRSDIVLAKSEAAKTNRAHKITFDFDNNAYSINTGPGWGVEIKRVPLSSQILLVEDDTDFVDPEDALKSALVFSGRGIPDIRSLPVPDPGQTRIQGRVVVEGAQQERRQVIVDLVGTVRLEPWP